jgi:hypothetical protein
MRLAEDRRGRVPFAVIGVLLLVGSATFAASTATTGPVREDHAVGTAMDRSTASARTALRAAIDEAARNAARDPLTARANTTLGRVVNGSSPFRDALRVRIYVAARERLEATRYRHSGVTAEVALPATPNASALRRAKRRVRVRGVDNGTSLRVRIAGLATEARRDGRIVAREPLSLTLTVATPVLALRDRTREFERRLNRSALAGPGLGRRLTARLYPLVWARGYAQYGGLPIGNVLANRHVAVSTNGGVLAVQRSVYGRSDPDGRRAMKRALVTLGAKDLLASTSSVGPEWADRVLPDPNAPVEDETGRGGATIPRAAPRDGAGPNRSMTVEVNATADLALEPMLSDARIGNRTSITALAHEGYRARLRLRTDVRRLDDDGKPAADPPGTGWRLVDETVTTETAVSRGEGPRAPLRGGERDLVRYSRRVTIERRVTRTWRRRGEEIGSQGENIERTDARWTERYAVGVVVAGKHVPSGRAPDRPVRPLFERGGPLDGPNLAGVRTRARSFVEARGGRDDVALAAVRGSSRPGPVPTFGARPEGLESWVYADLASLRDRVRNVSVTVRSGAVATGRANPPARLAAKLRARRAALIDAPDTYDGAADRVRVAARAVYLDRVLAALEARADRTRETNRGLGGALADADVGGLEEAAEVVDARRGVAPASRRVRIGRAVPGGNDTFVPDASPTYLTVAPVEGDRLATVPDGAAYRPLAARNTNLFTIPYGDAVDTAASGVLGSPDRVRLRTAARALVAANRTLDGTDDPALRDRRDELRVAVGDSLGVVRNRARGVLGRETDLDGAARRAAVTAAVGRWRGNGRRALAAANGSFAAAVADEALTRLADPDGVRRDRVRTAVRITVSRTVRSGDARVSESATNRTVSRARRLGERALKQAAKKQSARAIDRAQRRYLGKAVPAPAGLPVAPVPGYWYATVNVWDVRVRGEFGSFTVRTRRGAPDRPTPLQYVRDGSPVTLDVDEDGEAERLGRTERISFETGTTVAVAVPPYRNGVGDVGGDADERSRGWPHPGCDRHRDGRCDVGA